MICWYCYWGWPAQVVEIYKRGIGAAGESAMHFGHGHLVWEDENFETEDIEWCIEHAPEHSSGLSDSEVEAVTRSLQELLALPENIRCCEPSGYDGKNPEQYPPPSGLVMLHPHQ